ncbi:MAG: DUF1272 domain-containing protein [Alcanivoracaceae bacterium]|nr:DUF1272 domain-containing protein [Alcanivoracaceae bacterium]
MLEIRPNCELCDKDLPADSGDACICSYECTFCRSCVDELLENVCPNCGGGFVARPVRPKNVYREDTSIKFQPASDIRVNTKYSKSEIANFCQMIKNIPSQSR